MLRTVSHSIPTPAPQKDKNILNTKVRLTNSHSQHNTTMDQVHFSGGTDIITGVPEDLITGSDPVHGIVNRIIKVGIKGTMQSDRRPKIRSSYG
jgi:hypothetical protein